MSDAPIVLATCARWPELGASDTRLAEALQARGWRVEAAPWNGPFAPFASSAAVVVRATWDYHEAPDAYRTWLARLDPARTFNPPSLILWNLSKAHLLDLGARGVRVPRSLEVPAVAVAIADALEYLDLSDAVIKPLFGASGFGVERVIRGREAEALARAQMGKRADRLLVQEMVKGIERGEVAGVFFDGVLSHGLLRLPAPGDFRANSRFGGTMEATTLDPAIVREMASVLALLPTLPLYARVDGVATGGRLVLMELEVNEPGLGLDLVDGAAGRFAEAILARLAGPGRG